MAISVLDRLSRVTLRQRLGTRLAIDIILSTSIRRKVGRLMNEGSTLGISTGSRSIPESTAKIDMTKVIRVNVGIRVAVRAGAVEVVARVGVTVQVGEVGEDSAVVSRGVCSEPCCEPSSGGGVAGGVGVCGGSVGLGC